MNRLTSVLTHPLPESVTVDGVEIPIRTDYRAGILFDELAKDESLDDLSRMQLGLWLFCGDTLPEVDKGKLFAASLAFYRGEISCDAVKKPSCTEGKAADIFDFVWDGNQIYAAFRQVYHIDLTEVQLHWWKFIALLTALPKECAFMRTTALRCTDLRDIKDEELRRKIRHAKASVRIRRKQNVPKEKEESTWQTAP